MAKKQHIFPINICQRHLFGMQTGSQAYTDAEYAKVANQLCPVIGEHFDNYSDKDIEELALDLALYLEDIVSNGGQWRAFTDLHEQMYGSRVPFWDVHKDNMGVYGVFDGDADDTAEPAPYFLDEPNLEDVYFLVWRWYKRVNRVLPTVHHAACYKCAVAVTDMLLDCFETVPENPYLHQALVDTMTQDIYKMRIGLFGLISQCYVTRDPEYEEWVEEMIDVLAPMVKDDQQLAAYTAFGLMCYGHKTGPLGMYAVQWLEQMLRATGEAELADRLKGVEFRNLGYYSMEELSDDYVRLTGLRDHCVLDVEKAELKLEEGGAGLPGLIGAFFKFEGVWYLVGSCVFLPKGGFEHIKHDIDVQEGGRDVYKRIFGSSRLKYFADFNAMKAWLDSLIDKTAGDARKFNDLGNPEMKDSKDIVVYYDEVRGRMVASERVGRIVQDPDNPYYAPDDKESLDHGVSLAFESQAVSGSLMKYLLDNHMLDGVLQESPMFDPQSSLEQRRHDFDLVSRMMRLDDYGESLPVF